MRPQWMRTVYYQSPAIVRNAVASAYSWRANRLKFTGCFDACLAEIRETEQWPTGRQTELREQRLTEMLRYAAAHVPYYQKLFAHRGISSAAVSAGRLRELPVVDKQDLVTAGRSAWAPGFDARHVSVRHTSGTTGAGLVFPIDLPGLQREYAYFWAHNAWGGVSRGERVATFAGHSVAGPDQRRGPFWALSWIDNELFFSSQHMNPRNLEEYATALRRFAPVMLHGYPSSVYVMALFLLERGYTDVRPRVVFTGSETLLDYQRETIERAFACPVLNWYGNSEMVGNIVECEHRRMHIRELHSVLEVLDGNGEPVKPGQGGELVCTGLGNKAMPFIRYRIADTVALATDTVCPCGRGGRLVAEVLGRLEDIVITPDGRHIGRLDHIFKDLVTVAAAQIVQEVPERITIKVVRREGYSPGDTDSILEEAHLRLGSGVRVDLEFVDAIPRTPSGKFRFVISRVPLAIRGGRQVSEGAEAAISRRFGTASS